MVRKKTGTRRLQGGDDRIYNSKGDGIFLSLFCRGTVGGEHKKWLIGSLQARDVDGRVIWFESERGYARVDSDRLTKVFPPFTRWLDGDTYVHPENPDPFVFHHPAFRVVWDFKCPKCKFSYRVSKPETTYSVVEELVKVGVEELGIREFRQRVVRSASRT